MSIAPADLLGPYETVFDVGAFRGDFAKACLEAWPECVVHSFEPLEPSPNDRCRFNMGVDEPRWYWHPCALGNHCEVVEMHRNKFIPSSSMLPMAELHRTAFPFTDGDELVRVGMATLEEFAEQAEGESLLKIDVQGYELEVLKGAGEWLSRFTAVVLEVSYEPLYEGQPSPEAIDEYLTTSGFTWHSCVDEMAHPKDPRWRLQADQLWVRA